MKNPFLVTNMTPHPECLQEMVDNIPEDKKWECPECASVKIERRKVAVERARLKRVAQGRALVRSAMHCLFISLPWYPYQKTKFEQNCNWLSSGSNPHMVATA